MSIDCRRPGCPKSFDYQLCYDVHLLRDHGLPWEDIDNYPRSPSQR